MYLGIEIGGTKLQIGAGQGDGTVAALWRAQVDVASGAEGIRRQLVAGFGHILNQMRTSATCFRAVGIGFGGPVDDATRRVIKSHQIHGWDDFPLADWVGEALGLPAVLGNDADVAGLAEALFGAGKGFSPVFYITVGTGIGGGFILDGRIYRGVGRGASEIGHLQVQTEDGPSIVEHCASGWGLVRVAQQRLARGEGQDSLVVRANPDHRRLTAEAIAKAAEEGDDFARSVLDAGLRRLAEGICHVIALLCPRRIVVGGGVSLMGEKLFFEPLRRFVSERVFAPFADCYEIVPAQLGEAVVVHGALALAAQTTECGPALP